jgi:hypothetical protein
MPTAREERPDCRLSGVPRLPCLMSCLLRLFVFPRRRPHFATVQFNDAFLPHAIVPKHGRPPILRQFIIRYHHRGHAAHQAPPNTHTWLVSFQELWFRRLHSFRRLFLCYVDCNPSMMVFLITLGSCVLSVVRSQQADNSPATEPPLSSRTARAAALAHADGCCHLVFPQHCHHLHIQLVRFIKSILCDPVARQAQHRLRARPGTPLSKAS